MHVIDHNNLTPRSKIIFHIGMDKTGSTSIQHHLFYNRDTLREEFNIDYSHYGLVWGHHLALAAKFGFSSNDLKEFSDHPDQLPNWLNIADDLPAITSSTIFSSEHFCYGATPSKVRHLKNLFAPHECQVVAYVRNFSSWLRSLYKETFKWQPAVGFSEFVDYSDTRLDIVPFFNMWRHEFDGISVHSYDRYANDIVRSFVSIACSYFDCENWYEYKAINLVNNQNSSITDFDTIVLLVCHEHFGVSTGHHAHEIFQNYINFKNSTEYPEFINHFKFKLLPYTKTQIEKICNFERAAIQSGIIKLDDIEYFASSLSQYDEYNEDSTSLISFATEMARYTANLFLNYMPDK
jgi:hypothetical protein